MLSPVVASYELAFRLRARRLELGLAVRDLAKELGFTPNYWSGVENNRSVLAEDRLRAAVRVLDFGPDEAAELLALRGAAKERAWWNQPMLIDVVQQLYGLEDGAERIRAFEGVVVSGLLQTPSYARALIEASPFHRPADTDRLVETRLRRQERLLAEPPVHLQVVLGQATLLQQVREPEVLLDQLRHLVDVAERHHDTIEIRVLPFAHPMGGMTGAGTVCLLDLPRLPTAVAYQEALVEATITTAADTVRFLELCFEQAAANALDHDRSVELIEATAADLERQIRTG